MEYSNHLFEECKQLENGETCYKLTQIKRKLNKKNKRKSSNN